MSTKVGLFFAAAAPPAESSGNPGLVRCYFQSATTSHDTKLARITFDSLWSVETLHTSSYLVTSHARSPFQSLTRETGSVLRRRAKSAGGSRPEAREKGNDGASVCVIVARRRGLMIAGDGLTFARVIFRTTRFMVAVKTELCRYECRVGFIGESGVVPREWFHINRSTMRNALYNGRAAEMHQQPAAGFEAHYPIRPRCEGERCVPAQKGHAIT